MKEEKETFYSDIGERIRARRLELEWTQAQLAKRADISISFVGHLEREEKIPSVETLARICACMGLSLDFLVLGVKRECDRENCELYEDLKRMLAQYTGR